MVSASSAGHQHTDVPASVARLSSRWTNSWSMVGEHQSSQAWHCACDGRSETSQ